MTATRRDLSPFMQDISELEPVSQELLLKCASCRRVDRYDVGVIFLNPQPPSKANPLPIEDRILFTGYFRCRKCHSSGPWNFPEETKAFMLSTAVLVMSGQGQLELPEFQVGTIALFDGTICRSPAWAEDYLRGLIEKTTDNFFLHNRLANILRKAEMNDAARDEFEQAVQLNPQDIGSLHELACMEREDENEEAAILFFQQVLKYARHADYLKERERRLIVSDSLSHLLDMEALETALDAIREEKPETTRKPDAHPVVYMTEFELSKDEDWERLVDMFCFDPDNPTGRLAEIYNFVKKFGTPESPFDPEFVEPEYEPDFETEFLDEEGYPVVAPLHREARRISRNEPCPCGSGKKYKRCCGKH